LDALREPVHAFTYADAASDPYHKKLLPPVLRLLRQEAERRPNALRIFDVGCGNGSLTRALQQHGYDVMGIDASKEGIEHARLAYPGIEFHVCSVYDDLAARFGRFPIIISLEVVEHLTDPFTYARRLFDLVEPGGIALVSTPYHGYAKNLLLSLVGHWDTHWQTLNAPGWHIKFFSRATLASLLDGAGFEVATILRFGRPVKAFATGMLAVARRSATPPSLS
jgi:2-polyprenyl-6-hydroxyphenyl methylase/3-demethylubiquinone-9 3-methyltransferase